MIFFSEVACVSPSGSALQEFFSGSGRMHELFFFVRVCLQDIYFFKITPHRKMNNPIESYWIILIGPNCQFHSSDWLSTVLSDVRFRFECSARGYSTSAKKESSVFLFRSFESFLLIFKFSCVTRECLGKLAELLNDASLILNRSWPYLQICMLLFIFVLTFFVLWNSDPVRSVNKRESTTTRHVWRYGNHFILLTCQDIIHDSASFGFLAPLNVNLLAHIKA